VTDADLSGKTPLTVLDVRYLRKALRYRLGLRSSPPSGLNTDAMPVERHRELDEIAEWLLQVAR
jgi:hypothetical protein